MDRQQRHVQSLSRIRSTSIEAQQPTHTVDVSIACAYMILQAYELGLGTCWIGAFEEDEAKKILSIPEHVRVVAMTPLEYPNQPSSRKFRKSLDQIVCFEKYE